MSAIKKREPKKEKQNKRKSKSKSLIINKSKPKKQKSKPIKEKSYKDDFYYSIGDKKEKEMIKQNILQNRDENYVDIDVLFSSLSEEKKEPKEKRTKHEKKKKNNKNKKKNEKLKGGAEENETPTPEKPPKTPEKTETETPTTPSPTPEKPTETPEKPTETPEKPTDTPEKPTDTPEKPTDTPEKPTDTPEKPTDTPEKPTETPEKPSTTPEKPTETPETKDDNSLESLIEKAKKDDDNDDNTEGKKEEIKPTIEQGTNDDEEEKPVKNEEVEDFEADIMDKFNMDDEDDEEDILKRLKELKEKDEVGQREGYHLIGIDFEKILELLKKEKDIKLLELDYPGKYKNSEAREEAQEKLIKLKEEKSDRETSYEGKSSLDIFGDYIDEDADKLAAEILGLQEEISSVALNPGEVLTKESTVSEILEESKKYKREHIKITPRALYTMVKMLAKRKTSNLQWLRVASLCEIIYKFLNKGEDRSKFFKLKNKMNQEILEDLDEFWKTDFIFRGPVENQKYRDLLEKYYV